MGNEQEKLDKAMSSKIIIYQNKEGNIKIDVRLEEEIVWLTQNQMGINFFLNMFAI